MEVINKKMLWGGLVAVILLGCFLVSIRELGLFPVVLGFVIGFIYMSVARGIGWIK